MSRTHRGRQKETRVIIEHPNGFMEETSVEEIRREYAMSLEEYRYFVAGEPDGSAARSARRKERRGAADKKKAGPFPVPNGAFLAPVEFVHEEEPSPLEGGHQAQETQATSSRTRGKVTPTPIGRTLTDEERRSIEYPKGPRRPGFSQRATPPFISNYVPQPKALDVPEANKGHGPAERSFAEETVAYLHSVQEEKRREVWARKLLEAYYILYGPRWDHWPELIPWLTPDQLEELARQYDCDGQWDWMAKRDFIDSMGIPWSPDDLDHLVSWYPEYQDDHHEQRVLKGSKPFEEVQKVARGLKLPSQGDISLLAAQAAKMGG